MFRLRRTLDWVPSKERAGGSFSVAVRQVEHHADRGDPVSESHATAVLEGDTAEDDQQFARDDRLRNREQSRFQRTD